MADEDDLRRRYRIARGATEDLVAAAAKAAMTAGERSRRLHDLVAAALAVLGEAEHLLPSTSLLMPKSELESAIHDRGERAVVPDSEPINRAVRRCAYLLGYTRTDVDRMFAALRRLSSVMPPDVEILKSSGWASVFEVREVLPNAQAVVAITRGGVSPDLLEVLAAALGWPDRPSAVEAGPGAERSRPRATQP
jgi:hypothetical protein